MRIGYTSPVLNFMVTFNFEFWRENMREFFLAAVILAAADILLMDSAGEKLLVLRNVILPSQDIWDLSGFITECPTSQKTL